MNRHLSRGMPARLCLSLVAVAAAAFAASAQEVRLAREQQKLTAASNVRARSGPQTSAPEVARLKLGTVVGAVARSTEEAEIGGRRGHWFLVNLPGGGTAWVFGGLLTDYDPARRGQIVRRVAEERLKAETMTFEEGVDLYNFVASALAEAAAADERARLDLLRMRALDRSVRPIPYEERERAPYRDWLREHERGVVYHELAGSFQIASEALWGLEKKHRAAGAAADEIAWAAAENPMLGECEGDPVCDFLYTSDTDGRYLGLYPNGAHAAAALERIEAVLARPELKTRLNGRGGDQYQAEEQESVRKALARLRLAVSKTGAPRKAAILRRIDQLLPAAKAPARR